MSLHKFTLISFYLSVRSEIEESTHPMVEPGICFKGLAAFSSSAGVVSVVELSVLCSLSKHDSGVASAQLYVLLVLSVY